MNYYCGIGIDLHSNNHVAVVIDDKDKRVYEKRLGNDLNLTLKALMSFRESLQGIAVESTFNWYWLVDGQQEAEYQIFGIRVKLNSNSAIYNQSSWLFYCYNLVRKGRSGNNTQDVTVKLEEQSVIRHLTANIYSPD